MQLLHMLRSSLLCSLVLTCSLYPCIGEHVTPGGRPSRTTSGTFLESAVRDELHQAIAAALGGNHDLQHSRLQQVRADIEPMWNALAKNDNGRVDSRTLRYAVHRYLLNKRSLSIVGLEPLQQSSNVTALAALLTDHAPMYVKSVLEGDNAEKGFSIEDGVAMIAMVEELVAHQGHDLLATAYQSQMLAVDAPITAQSMDDLMETYILRWMMGDDQETVDLLEENRTLLLDSFEDWDVIVAFVKGLRIDYERSIESPGASLRPGSVKGMWKPLKRMHSFGDAQAVTSSLHLEFGNFWHTECSRVKTLLESLDKTATGRVKLSDFHAAAMGGEWRFGESKEYLRKLGALDESSTLWGPRVIMPNYLQGASNCIISDKQYRVCCRSDCEHHLAEIEAFVQDPLATAEQILEVVANISIGLDDAPVRVTGALKTQLQDIANTHHGKIPLHGRLFGQWLSFVFPRDCPFPHKSGTVNSVAPLEYGMDYMASEAEIEQHVFEEPVRAREPEDSWREQWSHEEELLTENIRIRTSWETIAVRALGALLLAGAAYAAWQQSIFIAAWQQSQKSQASGIQKDVHYPFSAKAHYV